MIKREMKASQFCTRVTLYARCSYPGCREQDECTADEQRAVVETLRDSGWSVSYKRDNIRCRCPKHKGKRALKE